MNCPSCGNRVPRRARFCPTCGAALGQPTAASAPPLVVTQNVVVNVKQQGRDDGCGHSGCGCLVVVLIVVAIVWFCGGSGQTAPAPTSQPTFQGP